MKNNYHNGNPDDGACDHDENVWSLVGIVRTYHNDNPDDENDDDSFLG
jgi:hypothetical protein